MKKALSALLAAVMVLGLAAVMPITAHAATLTANDETSLRTALTNAVSGDTIRLTANITYPDFIGINGKTVTLDLNGKTLSVNNYIYLNGSAKLLLLNPDDGQFNVSCDIPEQSVAGVFGVGSKLEVTNVNYTGVANVASTAVTTYNGGEITAYGNVTSNDTGAWAGNGGKITINGTLTVPADNTYIKLFNGTTTAKTAADYETNTTKEGYRTYTDGSSTVWVKIPAGGGGDGKDYFVLWGKTTTYDKALWYNWILLIFCFGWIWMAF